MAARVRTGILLVLFIHSLALATTVTAQEPGVPFIERSEEEVLILTVRLDNRRTGESIIGYQNSDGSFLLPLGQLARISTLAIEADPYTATASGFIISEDRTFRLNAANGSVELSGVRQTFPPEQVEVHEDDIYVAASLLDAWWPVNVRVDLQTLSVILQSEEPLPYELREQRERRGSLLGSRPGSRVLRYPLLIEPYELFQIPVLSLDVRADLTRTDSGERGSLFYSFGGAGDILGGSGRFFVTGTDDDPFSLARGTYGRWDPDGTLLGPLRARVAEVGEVNNPGSELLLRSSTGPGVHISNYPLFAQDRVESHTFRGELPPGWEVELYHNGVLIDFSRSGADALYAFADVPLNVGLNEFTLIFYGPRGEIREERVAFNILDILPEEGEFRYRLVANDARGRDGRALFQSDYGLTRWAAVHATAAAEETLSGETRSYLKTGLSGVFGLFFLAADLATDDDANLAVQFRANGRVGRWNLTLDHSELDGFTSEDLSSPFGTLESRSTLSLDGDLFTIRDSRLSSRFRLTREDVVDDPTGYILDHRLSTSIHRYFISHLLERRWVEGVDRPDEFTRGAILLSRPSRKLGLRGELSYDIEPEPGLRVASISADFDRWDPYLVQAGLDHLAKPESVTRLRLNLQRRTGEISWGVSFLIDQEAQGQIVLNASTTAFFPPGQTTPEFRGALVQGVSALSVIAFVDLDGDGELDPGEPPVEGAGVFLDRASHRETTDAAGKLLITSLSPYRDVEISLSRSTLPDPTMVPLIEGIAIRPRPGRVVELLFPVIYTGEVTGTVYAANGDPAGGAAIELVGPGGVVQRTISAFDGFFQFLETPLGTYQMRASKRGSTASEEVVLTREEPYADGVTIRLAPQ